MVQSQIAVHILVIISGSGCGTISGTNWPYQVKKMQYPGKKSCYVL